MKKQSPFAGSGLEKFARTTRRERFLAEMEQAVPWPALHEVIEPHYPRESRSRTGRPPRGLETLLRIQMLQH
jgi:IS5 family transposase